jgi:hypothetical protein
MAMKELFQMPNHRPPPLVDAPAAQASMASYDAQNDEMAVYYSEYTVG